MRSPLFMESHRCPLPACGIADCAPELRLSVAEVRSHAQLPGRYQVFPDGTAGLWWQASQRVGRGSPWPILCGWQQRW